MDYKKIYNQIIWRAKSRDWRSEHWSKGTVSVPFPVEAHHIVPRCLGGSDYRNNLVVLSLKEHFIAHLLLTKIYPKEDKIILAFNIMCNRTKGKSASDYDIQMSKYRKIQSNISKKMWTDEMREEYRERGLRLASDPAYIAKVSEGVRRAYRETDLRDKISKSSKLMWRNPDYREKIRKSLDEYWNDEDNVREMSNRVKEQNRKDPELRKKRLDGIKDHMYNKPKDWGERAGKWMNDWYKLPGNETVLRDRYFKEGNKFNNSRVVINKETGEEYPSMKQAAKALDMNYNTLKKYIYNSNPKCPVRFKEKENDKQ